MAEQTLELEGTWEEILKHSAELAGKQVRLTVLQPVEAQSPRSFPPNEELLAALQRIREIQQGMRPTPTEGTPGASFAEAARHAAELEKRLPLKDSGDSVALVREGRAGAMWGYEPAE